MTDMVERLARELCAVDGEDPDLLVAVGPVPYPVKFGYAAPLSAEPNWTFRTGYVRALLRAMRDPTEAMVRSGPWGGAEAWRSMIDAALNEKEGGGA